MTQRQTIGLHGAWQGQVGSPQREFAGQVTRSDLDSVAVGMPVRVIYTAPETRIPGAADHGHYTLSAGQAQLKLASLTCRAEAGPGKAGNDDTQPADWEAVLLPSAT